MTTTDPGTSADVSPVLRGMRIGQHVLFAVLLVIGTARGATEVRSPAVVVTGAVLLAAWYAVGIWLASRGRRQPVGLLWLASLVAGWLALVVLSVEFSWLAFSLFFLCLHLLPVRAAVPAVVALTAAVVVAQLAGGTGSPAAKVLGPCLGAAVAVAMALAYRRLVAENSERRRLVRQLMSAHDDLLAMQDELAGTQRQAGVLSERARLAREIHDTLAQGFSSILLLSRAGLTGGDDQGEALRQIGVTASENLDTARRVVHALQPAELEDTPLTAAIGRLVDRFSDQSGVAARMRVDGEPVPMPTTIEVALLRLAQGALANVRQHAGAARVGVTLTFGPDQVSLDVVDDGTGFDVAQVDRATPEGNGFGLRAMQERLAALGGTLVVESVPGEGTAVAAIIPLVGQVVTS